MSNATILIPVDGTGRHGRDNRCNLLVRVQHGGLMKMIIVFCAGIAVGIAIMPAHADSEARTVQALDRIAYQIGRCAK